MICLDVRSANRLIEAVLPRGGMVVALAEFYGDESESGRFYTVAAYIFTAEKAQALNAEWFPLLEKHGLPFFHMTDCAHGADTFKHLHNDAPARSNIQIEFFDILIRHYSVGFCVTLDKKEKHKLPHMPQIRGQQMTPHALCSYWLLYNTRRWMHEHYPDEQVAYHFEGGAGNQPQVKKIMDLTYGSPWHKAHFKMEAHSFVPKTHSGAIQCADILAWQWNKNTADRYEKKGRPLRADLKALLESGEHYATHFDAKQLDEFVELIASTAKAQ